MHEAIVLAGGLGTRLRSLVADVPKPMADINGRPFLDHVIRQLADNGVERAVISVGYRNEHIRNHFSNRCHGVTIDYAVEQEPLGTGGAIGHALGMIEGDRVFVLNGDTLCKVPLSNLIGVQGEHDADVVLTLKRMTGIERYGVVSVSPEGRIVRFVEKGRDRNGLINCGVYLMSTRLFDGESLPKSFSFEHYLEEAIDRKRLWGCPSEGYFIDIGVPEDYRRAQQELR